MKGLVKYLILILLCMFPFVVKAQEENKVKITNVELDSKSETVVVGEPTIEGVSIKFDLKFKEVNQFAKYKVTLKNDDTEDYELVSEKDTDTSTYITYEYEIDGESIIKAGEEKIIYVTATYTKEVPASELDDAGMYKESNASSIELVSGSLEVPDTLKNAGIVGILVILALIVAAIIMIAHNKETSMMLLIMALVLVPFTADALKQIKINVSAEIKIVPGASKFCKIEVPKEVILNASPKEASDANLGMPKLGTSSNTVSYEEFVDGETFAEHYDTENGYNYEVFDFYKPEVLECYSKYVDDELDSCIEENKLYPESYTTCLNRVPRPSDDAGNDAWNEYYDNQYYCTNEYKASFGNEKIKDASYGCYDMYAWRIANVE